MPERSIIKPMALINTKDGTKPSGIAMMSTAQNNGTKLQGRSTTVRVNTVNRTDYVYVASNSNITMWTFHGASDGKYYISAQCRRHTKYLKVSSGGVSLVDTFADSRLIIYGDRREWVHTQENTSSARPTVCSGSTVAISYVSQSNYSKADAWMKLCGAFGSERR